MANKFKIVLEGIPYGNGFQESTVLVNDREFPPGCERRHRHRGGPPHTVAFKGNGTVVDGISYPYEVFGLEQPRSGSTRKASSGAAGKRPAPSTAIMPGLIIKLPEEGGRGGEVRRGVRVW